MLCSSMTEVSKEDQACAVMRRDGIQEGLICILSCVEPSEEMDGTWKRGDLKKHPRKNAEGDPSAITSM